MLTIHTGMQNYWFFGQSTYIQNEHDTQDNSTPDS